MRSLKPSSFPGSGESWPRTSTSAFSDKSKTSNLDANISAGKRENKWPEKRHLGTEDKNEDLEETFF